MNTMSEKSRSNKSETTLLSVDSAAKRKMSKPSGSPSRRKSPYIQILRHEFGDRLQENVIMSNYTTVCVGGKADALLIIQSLQEFEETVLRLWDKNIPFYVMGNGSNLLISDAGVREVVLVNRCRGIKIDTHTDPLTVWAESGTNLSSLARQAALRGLSGLEWAAHIPGSLGGAVYGNAGIPSGGTHTSLVLAEILHRNKGKVNWDCQQFSYSYRSSALKREHESVSIDQSGEGKELLSHELICKQPDQAVILAARMKLLPGIQDDINARMDEIKELRRHTQPPGASLGSTFKNPKGDFAGRLLEAAGFKGMKSGGVEISPVHANYFINTGNASAADYWNLIQLARKTIMDKFGIWLELEIELLGDWQS